MAPESLPDPYHPTESMVLRVLPRLAATDGTVRWAERTGSGEPGSRQTYREKGSCWKFPRHQWMVEGQERNDCTHLSAEEVEQRAPRERPHNKNNGNAQFTTLHNRHCIPFAEVTTFAALSWET